MTRLTMHLQLTCLALALALAHTRTTAADRLAGQVRRLHDEEKGGEVVQTALIVAGLAAVAFIVVGIIREYAIDTARDLPGT